MKKRLTAILLAACLLMCLLAGCGGGKSESGKSNEPKEPSSAEESVSANKTEQATESEDVYERQTEEGTLTIGTCQDVDSFDPASSWNAIGEQLVYDSLFTRDPATNEIVGLLAESWEHIDDCTLKINMVQNATFSNGDPVTAEDVLYSFARQAEVGGRWVTFISEWDFEASEVVDDYTLILRSTVPFGAGIPYMTTNVQSVVNKEYVEENGEESFWDAPCSSGPYIVEENISGVGSVYKLRDDYWGDTTGMPETITVYNYKEPSTMFIDYENGVLDMAFELSASDAQRAYDGEVEHSQLVFSDDPGVYTLVFPEYVEYFQDPKVREAICHAINPDVVGETAFGVLYSPVNTVVASVVDYSYDCGRYEYDPELAVQLLEDAGYANGDIVLNMVAVNAPVQLKMLETVQAQLAEIGVVLNIESYDIATAIPMLQQGQTDFVMQDASAVVGDPDQAFNGFKMTSTNGAVRQSDETFNGYVVTARQSVETAIREENYQLAQQWLHDNYITIPICNKTIAYIYRDYINCADIGLSAATPQLRYVTFK